MATASTYEIAQKLYIAYYQRPADPEGLRFWADVIEASGGDLTNALNAFGLSPEATALYGEISEDNIGDVIDAIYQGAFGREADAAGKQFYIDGFIAGDFTPASIALDVLNGATGEDLVTINNKVSAADKFTNAVDGGPRDDEFGQRDPTVTYDADDITAARAWLADVSSLPNSVPSSAEAAAFVANTIGEGTGTGSGQAFMLTSGTDNIVGTDGDDMIEAPIAQNPTAGGVSNTLSSADRVEGGGGDDTLMAELVNEFVGVDGDSSSVTDVQPTTSGVETIKFEAREVEATDTIVVDAKRITGHDEIGSWYSDNDLTIENLTTLTDDGAIRLTSDLTVSMAYTDSFNSDNDPSDLEVLFDEDYLNTSTDTGGSTLLIRLVNAVTNVTGDNPIFGTDSFTIEVGDETVLVDVSDIAADPTLDTSTAYDQVVAAINTAMANAGFTDVTAAKQPLEESFFSIPVTDNNGVDRVAGESADTYHPILVTNTGSEELDEGDFTQAQVQQDTDINASMTAQPPTETEVPISINIDLEKVGRDGDGGNLVVGGKDTTGPGTDEDDNDGIQIFDVNVIGDEDKPSNLGRMLSTNGALQIINITTDAGETGEDGYAALTIRGTQPDSEGEGVANVSPFGGTVDVINAATFLGDLTIGDNPASAAQDVNQLTATGGGDVTFWANIDDGAAVSYVTGDGDDVFEVDLDGDAVDAVGESLSISTDAGDDAVDLTMLSGENDPDVSQLTLEQLRNINIATGDGEDEVNISEEILATITAGDGSDFVVFAGGGSGTWTFGQPTGPQLFGERVLYEATLTLTYAGFESTVSIATDAAGNFVADQTTINAAIIEAIESNPELARLLTAIPGTGSQQLFVTSTHGGENDLEVVITQPELVEDNATGAQVEIPTGSLFTALVQGIIDTTALDSDDLEDAAEVETALAGPNFGGAAFDGNVGADGVVGADYAAFDDGGSSDGGTENFSIVDMGDGSNDLVVLDSNDGSSNVLRISQEFGKVSVVNFHDDSPNDVTAAAQVGNHALDFTTFLNNQVDPSGTGNTQSATPIAVTLNTNGELTGSPASTGTALANSVNMLGYDETLTDSISFDGLTGSQLLEALNGTAAAGVVTGGLVDGDLDAVNTTANLIGTTQDHIVMVQNDQNPGEYKVFYLTSSTAGGGTGGDFASATLLGTLDFGNSINFNLVGSVEYAQLREDLLLAADIATDDQPTDTFPDGGGFTVAEAADAIANGVAPYSLSDTAANLAAADPAILNDADNITATTAATAAEGDVIEGATNTGDAVYDLSDTAANLAGAFFTTLSGAVNITATDAATAAQAETIADSFNSGTTTYNVVDTLGAIEGVADNTAASAKNGLAGAGSITAQVISGDEVVTIDNLDADAAATQIDFADNAATISVGDLNTLDGTSVAGDTITVQGTGGGDTIDASGEAATFVINGLGGGDSITGGDAADTLTGGAGADVFTLQDGGEVDTIADFATGSDAIQIDVKVSSTVTETATAVAKGVAGATTVTETATATATGVLSGIFAPGAYVGNTDADTTTATAPSTATPNNTFTNTNTATAVGGVLNLLSTAGTATLSFSTTGASASVASAEIWGSFKSLDAAISAMSGVTGLAKSQTYGAFVVIKSTTAASNGTLLAVNIKNDSDTAVQSNEISVAQTLAFLTGVTDLTSGDIVLI